MIRRRVEAFDSRLGIRNGAFHASVMAQNRIGHKLAHVGSRIGRIVLVTTAPVELKRSSRPKGRMVNAHGPVEETLLLESIANLARVM